MTGHDADVAYCRQMMRRRAEAEAGERIPTIDDLIRGAGWCGGDIEEDRVRSARMYRDELARRDLPEAANAREILDRLSDRNAADVPGLLRMSADALRMLVSRLEPDESSVRYPGHAMLPVSDPIAVICGSEGGTPESAAGERRHELAVLLRVVAERTILQCFCWGGWRSAGGAARGVVLRDAVLAIVRRRRRTIGITSAERIDLDLVEAGVVAWSATADLAEAPACLRRLREAARGEVVALSGELTAYRRFEMEAQESQREVLWRAEDGISSRHPAGRFDPDREEVQEPWPGDAPDVQNSSEDAPDADCSPEPRAVDGDFLVVVSTISCPESPAARAFVSELTSAGVIGQPLPLVRARDLAGVSRRLQAAFPHWAEPIGDLLGQLVEDAPIRFHPTVLLGPPGIGKTEFARTLARELGLGEMIVPCGAARDGSLAGTGRGWGTATLSMPLLAVLRHRIANPLLVLDELEKAAGSRQNGDPHSVLLGMLDQADAWEDPVVMAPVDLSAISWLATANGLDGLGPALRDRLRVLSLPPPRREHVPALIAGMLERIRREPRSEGCEPLTGEEIDAVCRVWSGGSLRSLRRLVEGVLTARERSATRH